MKHLSYSCKLKMQTCRKVLIILVISVCISIGKSLETLNSKTYHKVLCLEVIFTFILYINLAGSERAEWFMYN